MLRILAPLVAVSAVVATGLVHGIWTDRWAIAEEPAVWAAKLERVPVVVGDWKGRVVKANRKESGGVCGSLHAVYQNRRTGKEVTAFLVCGRPGPISVHTPDVCYGAVGYEVVSRQPFAVPVGTEAPAEFWTAQFRKNQTTDQVLLRIFWSWSGNGEWKAPRDREPRYAFAHCPALFKLYLIREMNSPDEPLDTDPCVDLMKQLLPQLQRSLFGENEPRPFGSEETPS